MSLWEAKLCHLVGFRLSLSCAFSMDTVDTLQTCLHHRMDVFGFHFAPKFKSLVCHRCGKGPFALPVLGPEKGRGTCFFSYLLNPPLFLLASALMRKIGENNFHEYDLVNLRDQSPKVPPEWRLSHLPSTQKLWDSVLPSYGAGVCRQSCSTVSFWSTLLYTQLSKRFDIDFSTSFNLCPLWTCVSLWQKVISQLAIFFFCADHNGEPYNILLQYSNRCKCCKRLLYLCKKKNLIGALGTAGYCLSNKWMSNNSIRSFQYYLKVKFTGQSSNN